MARTVKCPVCGSAPDSRTVTRTVPIWRKLEKDERIHVRVATCHRCGTDYELASFGASGPAWNDKLIGAVTATVILSVANGILGLMHAPREWNPVLAFYLGLGPLAFIAVKSLLTNSALVLLLAPKWRRGAPGGAVVRLIRFAPFPFLAALLAQVYFLLRIGPMGIG